MDEKQKKFFKRVVPTMAFLGGLCCFTPIVLVLLGLSSVGFAASLADTLYGTYKWAFRGVALALLLAALGWYFYKKENVCSFMCDGTPIWESILLSFKYCLNIAAEQNESRSAFS